MPSNARASALQILRRVEMGDAYASVLLRTSGSSGRDMALTTELVYGVLRRRMWLDHVIGVFSSRPLAAIDLPLLLILRLAVYQILFLDRVPDHAAVNEAVRSARLMGRGGKSMGAFVNGLLRTLLRQRGRIPPLPDPERAPDPAAALALAGSHPEWLVRRWVERFGLPQTAQLIAAANAPAPQALRANSLRIAPADLAAALAAEGVKTRPSRVLPGFLIAVEGSPQRTRAFDAGLFYIQDEAAGLVVALAGAAKGMRILDACAAPGGKSTAFAETLGGDGLVVAADRQPARLRLLAQNARRLGASCAAMAADMTVAPPLRPEALFDIVLVDAPCSGTGVIRRHPELRYRLSPEDLLRMTAIQSALLDRCAPLVRPGGALVYAVCSLEPEEGPERVRTLVAAHPELRPEVPSLGGPAGALIASSPEGPALVTLPHRDAMDGFFAMILRRHL